jgi:predicted Zn-dependent protease
MLYDTATPGQLAGVLAHEMAHTIAAVGLGIAFDLKLLRKQESGCDYIGMILMAKAGYDPQENINMMGATIRRYGRSYVPEFLHTHPTVSKILSGKTC